ncbi:unnamed protein product [Clonostachys rhizophaga]|uniref:Uncharacterized protein n=1 Tax=Clonostachys rhizophaga TaxID=160324 RepID=A0A9N9VRK2_9HYPO|nr:unnamed protein product [Clonostachys rhizophaga]
MASNGDFSDADDSDGSRISKKISMKAQPVQGDVPMAKRGDPMKPTTGPPCDEWPKIIHRDNQEYFARASEFWSEQGRNLRAFHQKAFLDGLKSLYQRPSFLHDCNRHPLAREYQRTDSFVYIVLFMFVFPGQSMKNKKPVSDALKHYPGWHPDVSDYATMVPSAKHQKSSENHQQTGSAKLTSKGIEELVDQACGEWLDRKGHGSINAPKGFKCVPLAYEEQCPTNKEVQRLIERQVDKVLDRKMDERMEKFFKEHTDVFVSGSRVKDFGNQLGVLTENFKRLRLSHLSKFTKITHERLPASLEPGATQPAGGPAPKTTYESTDTGKGKGKRPLNAESTADPSKKTRFK